VRRKLAALLSNWRGLSRKKKVLTMVSAGLILILAAGAVGYTYLYNKPRQSVSIDPQTGDLVVAEEKAPTLDDRINILLIASDQRDTNAKYFNTDSLILASIDPKSEQVSMLSIPRDTRVEIPKHGLNKINAAAALGGSLNMTVAVVQQLTGVKIDGYVETNFQGFKSIIDTLGGVTVNVEKDMYYETGDKQDGIIDLKKGEQVLDGSKALQYARFRHDTYGDITRTARQQVILKAVAKKLMEPGSLVKIPSLVPQFYNAVSTNLPLPDLIKITKALTKYDSSKVISQTLPGYYLDIDGISYWGVEPDKVKKVVADLFAGTVVGNTPDKMIEGSKTVTTTKPGENDPLDEPPAQVKVGVPSIDKSQTGETSITVMVSDSIGVADARLVRRANSPGALQGEFTCKTWKGEATIYTDKGLDPGTEYVYWLEVQDAKGNVQRSTPVAETTKPKASEPPPTVPGEVYSSGFTGK